MENFWNLNSLSLYGQNGAAIRPTCFLSTVPNLQKLAIALSDFKKMFLCEGPTCKEKHAQTQKAKSEVPSVARPAPPLPVATHPPEFVILFDEPSPLHTTRIVEKCTLKLVDKYKHMLCQATEPMSTFLEYITYGHMIDNVVLIVTGTLHERDVQELLEKCHPLGMFDSIGTELTRDDCRKLYSNFGLLFPYGHEELAVCEDIDQVRAVMEKYPPYQSIFSKLSYGESQMLDKAFYEEEFHYGVFFAYMRLREQEIRNLWISECVAQNQKSRVHDSVVFIF
ncbi:hypothetical protein LWI29_035775 [Acer saccharum]|uniref:Uncharacterized protein n=1 Tax=Acer saccharum TaxID=4024 RepID=A0AA39RYB7_ACESA|nr:hypothetical protein LWI29_035775 [Acer saccharum]